MIYNLVVDIGNTHSRIVGFDSKQAILARKKTFSNEQEIYNQVSRMSQGGCNLILSSVIPLSDSFIDKLKNKTKHCVFLDKTTKLPFINKYETPDTLGSDRLAALSGASHLYVGEDVLVVDAGTCITIDLLSKEGIYFGGAIIPGLNMQYKAMHEFTGKLPDILHNVDDPDYNEVFNQQLGWSTNKSMKMGVGFMQCRALDSIIDSYRVEMPEMVMLFTGGDAKFFERRLKNKIFANPDLTLIGLNLILDCN
jgi:type III pantothenate kinase